MNATQPQEGTMGTNGDYHWPVRVYYEDTDAIGLVYHANYFKFAERARTEMLRRLGIATNLSLVVRRCTADFIQPARLNDDLMVITQLTQLSGASLGFAQKIQRAETILVSLTFQIACIGQHGRACRLSPEFRTALLTYLVKCEKLMV